MCQFALFASCTPQVTVVLNDSVSINNEFLSETNDYKTSIPLLLFLLLLRLLPLLHTNIS
jgi:hypothetical protein